MGITLSMTGALRETGASFFFIPKGALTHHRPKGRRWYPSLRSGRALCEADCALFGERQTMPPCLRATVAIVCAEGEVHLSLSLQKPAPGSFIAEAGLLKLIGPLSLLRKRNRKRKYGGDSDWQYTTWRRRLSAEVRVDLLAQHRPI